MAGVLPAGWTEHTAPTGHKYYYNAALKKSTYKRPTLESPPEPAKPTQRQTPPTVKPLQPVAIPNTALNIRKQDNAVPLSEWSAEMAAARPRQQEPSAIPRMTEEMWKKLEDRPRKKANIPGAEPWVQVTTKWRRTFYHNPETGESYWKVPESIRAIVEQVQLDAARANAAPSESEEEEEDEDEYYEDDLPDEPEEQEKGLELTEEDIAWQIAQMQEEYGGAQDVMMMVEEEELDPATKRQVFISLLEEKDVNPFNTWETEMPKIVHDPRYSMLKNTKQRMEVFEEWTRARIAVIKEEKAQQKKEDPKEAFLRFLTEKADTKEYWFEFRKKNRKATEFKHWGTEKQKEDLWRDWCARTKMSREKREAELLSWMRTLKGSKEEIQDKVRVDVRYWALGDDKDDIVRDALRGRS